MPEKIAAGAAMPSLRLPAVGGGQVTTGEAGPGWQLVVVYRGRHCPLCKRYLAKLDGLREAFAAAATTIVAVSADPAEKAEADVAEFGWRFPVGYGLSADQMRTLGVYVSVPRSPQETDRPFAEPGLFLVNPEGRVQVVDISNAPFSRPDLEGILNGVKLIQERNYPVRGTMA
ncbi:MAG: redoxin domain-containing protein [Alphaproteobacteria bacterium]